MTREEEKYTTLDIEQCKWWVNHLFSMAKEQACNSHNFDDAEEMQSAQDKIIKALEQEPCEDCISRQELKKWLDVNFSFGGALRKIEMFDRIDKELPPVTPTKCIATIQFSKEDLKKICEERIEIAMEHGTCKDCKWWKDSDGTYKRGVRAESKCPINTKTVYLGNGYCYKFEPKMESESE